jgi:hypothetical protein
LIPRPLLALLGAVAIATTAWALLVPPFMVPDEAEHFAYVQSLAENGERPPAGTPQGPFFSTEQRLGRETARVTTLLADPERKPAWERAPESYWRSVESRFPADDIVATGPQAHHPPLYYAYEVAPYAVTPGGDPFDRLFLMRLWSGLLLLVTTTGAWLLIGELTRRDRLLQLAGAACVGLQPMSAFVSGGVNPDALLFAAFAIALWLVVRLVRQPPTWPAVAGLVASTGVAVFAKPAGLALVPAMVVVLLVLARRRGGRARKLAPVAVGVGALFVAAGVSVIGNLRDRAPVDVSPDYLRGFFTYVWDFYLPRLPFQHEYPPLSGDMPAWTVWVKQAWASFGLLEVQFPEGVYFVFAAVAATVLVGAAVALRRGALRLGRLELVLLGLTVGCLVVGVHWVDYRVVTEDNHRVIQGRYLLPLMPVVGVAVAAALSNLGRRRELGAALVLAGMAVLQLFSLAVVAGRYFA